MRWVRRAISYVMPPEVLKGFPNAQKAKPKTPRQGGGGLRRRWKGNGMIYEWDYRHGRVEVYDARGKHLRECDPDSGQQITGADSTKDVEP